MIFVCLVCLLTYFIILLPFQPHSLTILKTINSLFLGFSSDLTTLIIRCLANPYDFVENRVRDVLERVGFLLAMFIV